MLSPVVFTLSEAIQLKVAAELAVKAKFTTVPEQADVEDPLVIEGVWFTVTFTVWSAPTQDPAEVEVGVTV